jgi:hypothetical protein
LRCRSKDYQLSSEWHPRCYEKGVHATFFQKVILCAIAGFLAAALIEWGRVFVTGADDALNAGYQHHSVMGKP